MTFALCAAKTSRKHSLQKERIMMFIFYTTHLHNTKLKKMD